MGFIDRATEIVDKPMVSKAKRHEQMKNHGFSCKTSPGQPGNHAAATETGSAFAPLGLEML